MLRWLTNRLVLAPSRGAIEAEHKRRHHVEFQGGGLEIWRHLPEREKPEPPRPLELAVLKFPGAGGRAERATDHPLEVWPEVAAEIWALNPPGYGGSSGPAELRAMAAAALAAHDALRQHLAEIPLLVTGNSLGCTLALHVAAERKVQGLLLRNPPPLRQVIVGRFGWWNLGLGAGLVARQIPRELDAIANAARSSAPALFVLSERDRIVPPKYQMQIHASYAGPKRVFVLPDSGHADPVFPPHTYHYLKELDWLRRELLPPEDARR